MRLSLVIPCFNEEEPLRLFYDEVVRVVSSDEALSELELELLFIDDGSTDATLSIIKELAEADSRVRYISFSRNFGKESAIYAGLENTTGDYVVIMDSDMQDPPEKLVEMYAEITRGDCEIVRLRRVDRHGEPPIRSFFARMFYKLINRISDTEIVDGARDYQMMTRQVSDAIVSLKEYNRFFKGISGWVGFKTKWLEYQNVERVAGETKWSFWGLFKYAMDGILAFSTAPLVMASAFGIICFVLAIALMLFIFVRAALFGDPVSGWPSTMCLILTLGAIQLLCIGILGQYLSKTYLETKRRPIYIVREETE